MDKKYCENKIKKMKEDLDKVLKEIENISQLIKDNIIDERTKKDYGSVLENINKKEYNFVFTTMCVRGRHRISADPIYNENNIEVFRKVQNLKKDIDYWRYFLIDSEPVRMDGDIIITDPCYITENEDFDCMEWANKNGICKDTIYGDWNCTTYNSDTKDKIGNFCADSGTVCVVPLKSILKINPAFDLYLTRPWTTTIIKDFHGEVKILIEEEPYIYEGKEEMDYGVHVVGNGNINFRTEQTGL